jgi:hypothetical protein
LPDYKPGDDEEYIGEHLAETPKHPHDQNTREASDE